MGAIVVGSGIAGLTVALELGGCTLVTASALGASTSRHAQGGLAAAVGPDDSPARHAADTLAVGGGLSLPSVVEMVTAQAPARVRWLHELGTVFDTDTGGTWRLGREAGHERRRIVHAGGDATGAEVVRALVTAVRDRSDIEVLEHHRTLDLIRSRGRVVGVTVADAHGRPDALLGSAVVLATGGIGRAFARTTNPIEAVGDGLAMALRSGATIRDPEFVQFHPTALDSARDPLPLLTEALRGEGARLVDAAGRRYLLGVHPAAELAPRDVVARATWLHQQRHGPVFLDARHLGDRLPERFPTVFAAVVDAGIDPRTEPIPTTPAQHYHVGGIATDRQGRTDVPGLYACGEAASVGLHGANRLASNSLVEGIVMGARVAADVARLPASISPVHDLEVPDGAPVADRPGDPTTTERLRDLLWSHGGLVRDADGLTSALDELAHLRPALELDTTGRNLALVAEVVLRGALGRRESRGGHHRADHPLPIPGPGGHTTIRRPDVPHVPLGTAHRQAAS